MEGRFPRNDQIIMITPLSPIWGLFLRFAPLGVGLDGGFVEVLSDGRHPETARRRRQRDRGVPRGPKAKEGACSRLLQICFTGSASDVRHLGLLFKALKPLKYLKSLEIPQKPRNLPEGACSRLLQNVFLRDPKATLDIWACPSNPSNPSKASKLVPQSLKSLETCQKGLARGCFKMFFYGIRKRR